MESITPRRRLLLGCACCTIGSLLMPLRAGARNASGSLTPADAVSASAGLLAAETANVPSWQANLLRGARTLWLVRGKEEIRSTYWSPDGGYQGDSYKEICWLLRDVQASKSYAMSPRLLDVLCGLQNWLAKNGVQSPMHINSGYRTFATNIRTEGAALSSKHMLGKAADITVAGVTLARLAGMASLFGKGGVGMYVRKGFVHVDTGDERLWIG